MERTRAARICSGMALNGFETRSNGMVMHRIEERGGGRDKLREESLGKGIESPCGAMKG